MKIKKGITRRNFVKKTTLVSGTIIVTNQILSSCNNVLKNDGPFFGNGCKNGWADQNSISIWSRLTENPNAGDFNQAVASPMGSIKKNDEETVADANVTGKDPSVVSEADDEEVNEAEYQGRKVTLNKPMQGDVKKSKVYVKNAKGNVVKVNFGQKGMSIKKNNPGSRKSFRARHNCKNPGPKWKARYWSCRAW